MWIQTGNEFITPDKQGFYNVYGTINKGTEHETETIFTAYWNGEVFTDKDGEDLTNIDESITFWFDITAAPKPSEYYTGYKSMQQHTLDSFALYALTAIARPFELLSQIPRHEYSQNIAENCYILAEAMLKEREKHLIK